MKAYVRPEVSVIYGRVGAKYSFDYEHRLKSVSGPVATSYVYDGADNRLEATRAGVKTRYIYNAGGNLLAETDGNNNILRYYIHGAGLMAMVNAVTSQIYCYHYNAQGGTIAMTDLNGSFVARYAYGPFGELRNSSEFVPNPFKYVGEYGVMTESNGLYYMRARYYDPAVKRFISEDPNGFGGGDVNLYAYVSSNPIGQVDPSGLCATKAWNDFIKDYHTKEALKPFVTSSFFEISTALNFATGGVEVAAAKGAGGLLRNSLGLAKYGNSKANAVFKAVTKRLDMAEEMAEEFSEYFHKIKRLEGRKGANNYGFKELMQMGKEFLNSYGK